MRLLLDTHALLWWLSDPELLSSQARDAIRDGKNEVAVSSAVLWEIAIKHSLGKLSLPDRIEQVLEANDFMPLPITWAHALAVKALPLHHRDPFDRMLVAQALCDQLTIVTRDPDIPRYAVSQIIA